MTPTKPTRRRFALAALLLAALPSAALANNRGKKRAGGHGSSGKGGRYVRR